MKSIWYSASVATRPLARDCECAVAVVVVDFCDNLPAMDVFRVPTPNLSYFTH